MNRTSGKWGRLGRKMPMTYWTFLIGALALYGLWPFSGFFSKDAFSGGFITTCFEGNLLFAVGLFVAVLTAFYMFRFLVRACSSAR